jgi:hypothetical protein
MAPIPSPTIPPQGTGQGGITFHHHRNVHELLINLPLWFLIYPNSHKLRIDSSYSDQSRGDILALTEDIIEKYPQIQVVVIDGIGGTLQDWREESEYLDDQVWIR